MDGIVAVRQLGGAVAMRIDYVEARAMAAGFHDEGPEMDVGGEDIGAPGDDEAGMGELFGLGAVAVTECLHKTGAAGTGADGAVQAGSAEAVEEAAVHASAVQ